LRADQLLVERGLASSRAQAQRLIAAGVRWFDGAAWKVVAKNGDLLGDAVPLELLDAAEARYVSRGGLKLEGALAATGVQVAGRHCLDVGQSTGGFTDCLLRSGAAHVTGIDVGQGQLHASLRADPRVTCIEGVNARNLEATDLIAEGGDWERGPGLFGLIVADVSFISLTLVLPALVPFLDEGGDLLVLVKPQFELQPGQVGKGGIVRDAALYAVVEQRLRACCAELGLQVTAWLDSPVAGGDGNREFFMCAVRKP
jgi:23S rRNA (cytidine1920-2'-O)/16S rRNA (cytidine1409-2'-O)-methyltransferase